MTCVYGPGASRGYPLPLTPGLPSMSEDGYWSILICVLSLTWRYTPSATQHFQRSQQVLRQECQPGSRRRQVRTRLTISAVCSGTSHKSHLDSPPRDSALHWGLRMASALVAIRMTGPLDPSFTECWPCPKGSPL